MRIAPSGEILNTSSSGLRTDPGREFDGFEISAYVDRDHEHAWGVRYGFAPDRIEDPEHATAIARILRKVRTGLDRLNREQGYLSPDDITGCIFRIASILKITKYCTRNTREQHAASGTWNKPAEGIDVQYWIHAREREHCKPKKEGGEA